MTKKLLNLALQGGGSHGAYTWGILDRLLEEKDIEIHAVSGTSAGAMNAVVLADGLRRGGREEAKENLHEFWQQISEMGAYINPNRQNYLEHYAEGWNIDKSFGYQWFEALSRLFSPYQLNPFNINPMRAFLAKTIDWDTIKRGGECHLFITATSVTTGRPRVFRCHEITEDVVLASACLPFLFQSVIIDEEPYWDGGYMGNPSIWPLIYHTDVSDVLLLQINPLIRHGIPKTVHEIMNRMNEITFNSSLVAEMRAINFVSELVEQGKLNDEKYRKVHMHMVPAIDETYGLNASSKVNTDWNFLQFLHAMGREKTETWLSTHKSSIGHKSSLNIAEEFLGIHPPHSNPADYKKPKKTSAKKPQ